MSRATGVTTASGHHGADHHTDALWRRLMRLQCDLSFPIELHCYHALERWHAAERVLDLGTGNGYYLYRLGSFFRDKTYAGVDVSRAHIAAAERLPWSRVVRERPVFTVADYRDYVGRHDFVIARLLAQHLPSLDVFLEHVGTLLRAGGSLLVIEANDAGRLFHPRLPVIEELFETLRANRRAAGLDRDAALRLAELASTKGFVCARRFSLVVPSSVGANKRLFTRSYGTVLEIVKSAYKISLDYEAAAEELRRWGAAQNGYAEIGVHVASYTRG